MRATCQASIEPSVHVRVNGCSADLAACRATHPECVTQIEELRHAPWWEIDLERLPGSNLNLTRLHEELNGAIGDADMEGTSASLTHEQQLYVYLASRSSVQTICEVRIQGRLYYVVPFSERLLV